MIFGVGEDDAFIIFVVVSADVIAAGISTSYNDSPRFRDDSVLGGLESGGRRAYVCFLTYVFGEGKGADWELIYPCSVVLERIFALPYEVDGWLFCVRGFFLV